MGRFISRILKSCTSAPAASAPANAIFKAARLIEVSAIDPPTPTTFVLFIILRFLNLSQDVVSTFAQTALDYLSVLPSLERGEGWRAGSFERGEGMYCTDGRRWAVWG